MKRQFAPFAAVAMIMGSTAGADPFLDSVVRNLQDLGYSYIEIDRGRSQLRAEAVRGSEELTVVYDLATGRILRQETGRADAWYIGRDGLEIRTRDRDFTGDGGSGRSRDDFDDDDDDDDDDDNRSGRGRDDFDDDDDDDDRSRSSSGSGRDDNDDNDDDDDDG
jgi:hypothetical protein